MSILSKDKTLELLREYCRGLHHVKSPFGKFLTQPQFPSDFKSWLEENSPERVLKLALFYQALNQGVYASDLEQEIQNLWNVYGEKIFKLNNIPYEELCANINSQKWKSDVSRQVPGIIRSVCDFYLLHSSLKTWLSQAESLEPILEEISGKIFYMGKNSLQKPKVRMFLIAVLEQFPHLLDYAWEKDGTLPLPPEAKRLLRTLKPPAFYQNYDNPEEEWEAYNQLLRKIFPTQSWRAYIPFSIFKKRVDRNVYACQNVPGDCSSCVLNQKCWPSKKSF